MSQVQVFGLCTNCTFFIPQSEFRNPNFFDPALLLATRRSLLTVLSDPALGHLQCLLTIHQLAE